MFLSKGIIMIHSILIIGQSNMAGRGFIEDAPALKNEDRLRVLRNGRWQYFFRPVNPDRDFSGVCLAESFADSYATDHEGVNVGIIPCADGGSSLHSWRVGGLLYDNALNTARLAMRTSHIVAVLWHQGEADCAPDKNPYVEEKTKKILSSLVKEIGIPDVPVIIGGLGEYLADCPLDDNLKNYNKVNESLKKVAKALPYAAYVSSAGLEPNPDILHFNAAALAEFGKRYYSEFSKLENKDKVYYEKPDADDCIRTAMELL